MTEHATPSDAGTYQIRVRSHLDPRWAERLGVDRLTHEAGATVLHGPDLDQPALHGLLQRLRDLGLPLISVIRIEPTTTNPEGKP